MKSLGRCKRCLPLWKMKSETETILKLIDSFIEIPNVDSLPTTTILNMLRLRIVDPYFYEK